MAKILGKTHSPYVPDAVTHSLTLKNTRILPITDLHWLFTSKISTIKFHFKCTQMRISMFGFVNRKQSNSWSKYLDLESTLK